MNRITNIINHSVYKFPIKHWKGKFCMEPFVFIQIQLDGTVKLCGCSSWQPTSIGNIFKNTLPELLNSSIAQEIRKSIIDGTYEYCNEKMCGVIVNDQLMTYDQLPPNVQNLVADHTKFDLPYIISLHGDQTCNLSCPSCRTHIIKSTPEQLDTQEKIAQMLYENIFSIASDRPIELMTSGTGEVFASPLILKLLGKIDISKLPNLKLHINSNGLMAEKNWHRIQHLEKNITKITVSVDAAQAETYEKIRRGGKWEDILSALKFLQSKKHQLGFKLHTRMIVQQQNYQQIVEFYDFCKTYDVDIIEYSQLTNWGTWSSEEFMNHNVFDHQHLEYPNAKKLIEIVREKHDTWFEGAFI